MYALISSYNSFCHFICKNVLALFSVYGGEIIKKIRDKKNYIHDDRFVNLSQQFDTRCIVIVRIIC